MPLRTSLAAIAAMLALAAAAFATPSTASADAGTSPPRPVGTAGLPAPHGDDQPAGSGSTALAAATACVTGGVTYLDQNGATRPSINLQVQAWDRDDNADDLLKTGVTGADGRYTLCFDNDDGIGGKGQDVYVKLITENARWKVQNSSGARYATRVDGPSNLADGTTHDFHIRQPPSTQMRAWHAFDEANDAWNLVPHDARNCWATSAAETACQQLVIEWSRDVIIPIPYYGGSPSKVKLSADTPDSRNSVVHEIGHFVMHSAYGTPEFNSIEDCPDLSHAPDRSSNAGCAWSEGFANWFAVAVYQDPVFRWPDGTEADFEAATFGTASNGQLWHVGDTVEGRVAGALLDLTDWANEQPYDRFGEGAGPIWNTLMGKVSHTFKEFWQQHGQSSPQALASLYQNTIDYGFRDPLADYGELTRDFTKLGSPFPHNYRYASNTYYWSVVATRPQNGVDAGGTGVDVDLKLYDDANLTTRLAFSAGGGSVIDFVAVDSNHRAVGDDYYPQTNLFDDGPGLTGYRIELAQGSGKLEPGWPGASLQNVTMQPADVVAVRDVYLHAGKPTRISVTPTNANQNAEIFLMGSDPADPGTWVRRRGTAVAGSTGGKAGEDESITYTPPRDGWYGFVLLNALDPATDLDGGGGTYTVIREDLAPSGAALATSAATDPRKPSSTDGPER